MFADNTAITGFWRQWSEDRWENEPEAVGGFEDTFGSHL